MGLKRMDNVGIVVDDLVATIDFFLEIGLDGRATIEVEWAGRVTGLGDQRVEIPMMRTPDGHGGSNSPAFSRRPPSRICEQHSDRPWPHDDCSGSGDPCSDCNTEHPRRMPSGFRSIVKWMARG
jgi:hypothetical protein